MKKSALSVVTELDRLTERAHALSTAMSKLDPDKHQRERSLLNDMYKEVSEQRRKLIDVLDKTEVDV